MSVNFDDENFEEGEFGEDGFGTPTATLRGRDWPTLRQFIVSMENKVGELHDLLRNIESDNMRVLALSVVDSHDFAVARVIVSEYERGLELLKLSGLNFYESDLVGVELPDTPQPHLSVCTALLAAEVNIHYTYPMLFRRNGRGAIALAVDDTDGAINSLNEAGLNVITETNLLEDDEYL